MFPAETSSSLLGKPLSIVVADDVAEIQHLIDCWLTEMGHRVRCASSGREALQLLRARKVDVLVTDVLMPDGDGLEVLTELRGFKKSPRVLAISGGGSHLQAIDCLKFAKALGAHAVLLKPFNRDQLITAIDLLMAPA